MTQNLQGNEGMASPRLLRRALSAVVRACVIVALALWQVACANDPDELHPQPEADARRNVRPAAPSASPSEPAAVRSGDVESVATASGADEEGAVSAGSTADVQGAREERAGALASPARAPGLEVRRDSPEIFVGGEPRFLLGVSLFDALGTKPPDVQTLARLRDAGVSVVRVWAHWHDPIYAADGSLTDAGRDRLLALVRRMAEHELILELVLLRPGQMPGEQFAIFQDEDARRRAVREIASALVSQPNVFFDIYNEHDHPHGRVSHAQAAAFRQEVDRADPDRLVTISSTEYHVVDAKGVVDQDGRAALREEIETVGVDFVSVHLPRTADWADSTARRVAAIREALDAIGLPRPLYLNEEQRAREGETPIPASAYVRAAAGARERGAAGWTFHTDAGYDLDAADFFEGLNVEERRALERLDAPSGQP